MRVSNARYLTSILCYSAAQSGSLTCSTSAPSAARAQIQPYPLCKRECDAFKTTFQDLKGCAKDNETFQWEALEMFLDVHEEECQKEVGVGGCQIAARDSTSCGFGPNNNSESLLSYCLLYPQDACCTARPTPPGGELTPPNSSEAEIESKISGPSRGTLTIAIVVLVIALIILVGVWVWFTRRRLAKERSEIEQACGGGSTYSSQSLKSLPPIPPMPQSRRVGKTVRITLPSWNRIEESTAPAETFVGLANLPNKVHESVLDLYYTQPLTPQTPPIILSPPPPAAFVSYDQDKTLVRNMTAKHDEDLDSIVKKNPGSWGGILACDKGDSIVWEEYEDDTETDKELRYSRSFLGLLMKGTVPEDVGYMILSAANAILASLALTILSAVGTVNAAPVNPAGNSAASPQPGTACDPNFQIERCIGTRIGLCYYNIWIVTPCGGNRVCTGDPGSVWCQNPGGPSPIVTTDGPRFPAGAGLATTRTRLTSTTAVPLPTQPAVTPVPNQYIVVFKSTAQTAIIRGHETWLNRTASIGSAFAPRFSRLDGFSYPNITAFPSYSLLHKYSSSSASGFKGYAAKISPEIAASLRSLPEIDSVEQDAIISYVRPRSRINSAQQASGAPWGLRRLSKAALPLPAAYTYPVEAGAGVDVYVVDTGVDVGNPEFEGRAKIGVSFSKDKNDIDGEGHGSHVAGTVAGKTYGVAKKANILAVKVLAADGTGLNSDVIAGLNWAVQQAASTRRKSVVNMSLGGGRSTSLESAVAAAVKAGVTVVVAAGNENVDACTTSPAVVPEAITVGASSESDTFADFSNFGKCVDIIAPGVEIESINHQRSVMTISGTSMASPHVAGVVAVGMSTGRVTTPNDAIAFLKSFGTSNKISTVKGTDIDKCNLKVSFINDPKKLHVRCKKHYYVNNNKDNHSD
ncbi:serine protease [Chytridiales sp. JEL 0842]|nr:serine protease [Chytridiales sp. JEL 0842]